MFLEISQYSHESTCARVSFLIKLQEKREIVLKQTCCISEELGLLEQKITDACGNILKTKNPA